MKASVLISKLRLGAALAAAAALASGCALQQGAGGQHAASTDFSKSSSSNRDLSVLMEAPDRKELTCRSQQPLSVQHALNDIVFSCEEFGVEATLIEMRDAGWRLVAVNVGQETTHEGVVEMPLSIRIIKLF